MYVEYKRSSNIVILVIYMQDVHIVKSESSIPTPGFRSAKVGSCAIIVHVIWVDINLLQQSNIDKKKL